MLLLSKTPVICEQIVPFFCFCSVRLEDFKISVDSSVFGEFPRRHQITRTWIREWTVDQNILHISQQYKDKNEDFISRMVLVVELHDNKILAYIYEYLIVLGKQTSNFLLHLIDRWLCTGFITVVILWTNSKQVFIR